MHDVLQLAHVPRPVVARQHLERARRHAPHVAVALARGLPDEVLDEERNVLAPLAERRHVDRHDVQAIVEVLTELARPHRGLEVDVGRGDDAHVDRDGPQPAEALDLALLEGAEELRLEVQAQRADLVEEHRPAVGELELPELAGVGAGERALLVAEELRLDQRVGDGGDVHGDERLGEVVVGAAVGRVARRARLTHGRDQHDDRGRVHGQDAGQDLDPGLSWHALVEHDEVDLVDAEQVERRGAVFRLEDVARLFEDHADRRAHPLLVVDDEDGAPARELGRLGDHGWRDRSMTRYSARPPLDGRWTKTRTRSPGLSCASIRKSAAGAATGFLPTSTMTAAPPRPAPAARPARPTSGTCSPPPTRCPDSAAASPLIAPTPRTP